MASGDTLFKFIPQSNEPPAANFATADTRNTTSPHPLLDFAIDEIGIFSGVMPRNYAGGGVTVYLHYAMSSASANSTRRSVSR